LENPATLAAEVSGLFPSGVIAAELTVAAPRELLTSAEKQLMARCAEKRIQDFAAGRACAHRALHELGILEFSLLAGEHREPLWPAGIIGSITHTRGYAAAVVARQRDLKSVGLDCEVIESVDEDLWSRICTPSEIERLAQLPPAGRNRQAALIFAAKEAFYKCQFPLTRAWVGFEDVVIEPLDWQATTGSLRIVPQKTLPLETVVVARLVSRFHFRGPWVIAAVTVPN
jgi:4'-phosphopantetheinyl transferase EntD